VTVTQFQRGLGLCGTKLSRQELAAVIQTYAVKRNGMPMIDYAAFSKKIDEGITYAYANYLRALIFLSCRVTHLTIIMFICSLLSLLFSLLVLLYSQVTTNPFNSGSEFVKKVRSNTEKEFKAQNQLSDADAKLLEGAQQYVRQYVRSFGVLMKPFFRDQDRRRTGCVRVHHFSSTLSTVGIELSQQELRLIVWKYSSKKDAGSVNYMAFLKYMNLSQGKTRPSDLTYSARLKTYVKTKEVSSTDVLNALFTRIQARVANTEFALWDKFRDFDGLRKYAIHPSKLHSCLFLIPKVSLSQTDMQVICQHFPSVKFPDRVDYKAFLKAGMLWL